MLNQDSDFSLPIVKASRGTILCINGDVQVVCHAFDKFHNHGEKWADTIDWNTAVVREKFDGSIVKLYFNPISHNWQFALNNCFDCEVPLPSTIFSDHETGTTNAKTFQDLIDFALKPHQINFETLPKGYTFMFELISPRNRVVIDYKQTRLVLLGCRNNTTDVEIEPEKTNGLFFNYTFLTPTVYEIKNIQMAIEQAEKQGSKHEGFVVCDANFNRVKVKGEAYLALHKVKDNKGQFTWKRLFDCIKQGVQDDIISYYQETVPYIEKLQMVYRDFIRGLNNNLNCCLKFWDTLKDYPEINPKKKYAEYVLSNCKNIAWCAFRLCDNVSIKKIVADCLDKMDYENFVKMTGFEEKI